MTSTFDRKLIKRFESDLGSFFFYKNFVVSEVKANAVITYHNSCGIHELIKSHYGDTEPFVYIANRINSYSFNPTDHFRTEKIFPNLLGFASVTYDNINDEIAELEKAFIIKPVKNFQSLEMAIDWVEELLKKHK